MAIKLFLSPAKKLNFSKESPLPLSKATFLNECKDILTVLQSKNTSEISALMNLSKDLAHLNYERYQYFDSAATQAAILAFNGEVYNGLQANSWTKELLLKAQNQLYILSGLYGILKPLDEIKPYRLEMGTKLPINDHKNLHTFWQKKLTSFIHENIHENDLILNLASVEYTKAILWKNLPNKIIEPKFKEFKNGNHKTIMMYAKKARGLMAKFVLENDCSTREDIQSFNLDGYTYNTELSNNKQYVFTR